VDTVYVLDEPTIGLHPADNDRLLRLLVQLRDGGNSVIVVEHDAAAMRLADRIIELGPASGERGGELVFEGSVPALLQTETLTGPLPVRAGGAVPLPGAPAGRVRAEHPGGRERASTTCAAWTRSFRSAASPW
jgi:excinuclease ABC subunit A